MKIFIATPCAHELANSNYVATLFYITKYLERSGVDTDITLISLSDLELARSMFASRILEDKSFTHLLFIDSDMSFQSKLIKRMIEFDQDFISAVCPKRSIDISKIISDVRSYESDTELQADKIISINSEYTGVLDVNSDGAKSEVEINRGFVKAKYTGMAICLIKRRVLEDMVARAVVEKRENGPHPASPWPVPYYGFFHKRRASDGQFDSEDISFCKRWTQDCGGNIWACVDENIGHHGTFKYSGAYIEKLKAGRM